MPLVTPDSTQLQTEAERAIRRGDLHEGLRLYSLALQEIGLNSDATQIRARMSAIASLLQPDEQMPPEQPSAVTDWLTNRRTTNQQTAEMLFDRGDLPGAIATYERILDSRGDDLLARERLEELERLREIANAGRPADSFPVLPNLPAPPQKPETTPAALERILVQIASRRRM